MPNADQKLFTVNLIILLREKSVYYKYLVKKENNPYINTNQELPHLLSLLNLTTNL